VLCVRSIARRVWKKKRNSIFLVGDVVVSLWRIENLIEEHRSDRRTASFCILSVDDKGFLCDMFQSWGFSTIFVFKIDRKIRENFQEIPNFLV
jgi:hypothetical protein